MKNIDFEKAKAQQKKKNGEWTNELLIDEISDMVKKNEITDFVVVFLDSNNDYRISHSEMKNITALGMLDIGKDITINMMKE
jgi:hypothetical protein